MARCKQNDPRCTSYILEVPNGQATDLVATRHTISHDHGVSIVWNAAINNGRSPQSKCLLTHVHLPNRASSDSSNVEIAVRAPSSRLFWGAQ